MIRQIKKGLRKSAVTQEQLDSLNDVEGWIWENPMSFTKNYNAWVASYTKLGAAPSVESTDKKEKAAAKWQLDIRNTYHGVSNHRVLTPENIARLTATPGWTW